MRGTFQALVCLLAVACACTPAPGAPAPVEAWQTDGEITSWLGSEPDTIDPQKASFHGEASVIGMVYEALLTYDPTTLALIPAAARALPEISADGLTYTYRLRGGLTYSDGAPLTAGDFSFAWRRLCDPNTAGEFAFVAYPIAGCEKLNELDPRRTPASELEAARNALGVRATDAVTLEFHLTKPAPQFMQATALWVGSPVRERDVSAGGGWTDPTTYIGNGPFTLAKWEHNVKLVFERNERYREPVRLKRWTKIVSDDAMTMRAAYEEGRLDILPVAPRTDDERETLLIRDDLVRRLGSCTFYVGFNTQRAPFDDPLVRLAFAKALDKEDFARSIERTGRAAASLIPHGQPGHAHEDTAQAFDPAEARRLLAASRYGAPRDGLIGGIPIRFTISQSQRNQARVTWAIAQWLANLGIPVELDVVVNGWGQLIKRPQQLPQMYMSGWCADFPDPQNWLDQFHTQERPNRLFFSNAAFDALIDRAGAERDPAARDQLYQSASFVLSRSAPAAYLDWSELWTLVRPDVRGYAASSFDWDFAQFSLRTIYRHGSTVLVSKDSGSGGERGAFAERRGECHGADRHQPKTRGCDDQHRTSDRGRRTGDRE
jgi:oligopeptide transport system substrate-binding protein